METWAPDSVNLTAVRATAVADATSSWRYYMDVRQPAARSAMLTVSVEMDEVCVVCIHLAPSPDGGQDHDKSEVQA